MKADVVTRAFLSDTDVLADVFNYYIYDGEQMIQPEQLVEKDSVEIPLSVEFLYTLLDDILFIP